MWREEEVVEERPQLELPMPEWREPPQPEEASPDPDEERGVVVIDLM